MRTKRSDPKYFVFTWCIDAQMFTPQKHVRYGPHSPHRLKLALYALKAMGFSAYSVLVVRREQLQRYNLRMRQ